MANAFYCFVVGSCHKHKWFLMVDSFCFKEKLKKTEQPAGCTDLNFKWGRAFCRHQRLDLGSITCTVEYAFYKERKNHWNKETKTLLYPQCQHTSHKGCKSSSHLRKVYKKGKSGNIQNLQRKIVSSKMLNMATAAANVNFWPERSCRVFFLTGTPPKSSKYKKVNLG